MLVRSCRLSPRKERQFRDISEKEQLAISAAMSTTPRGGSPVKQSMSQEDAVDDMNEISMIDQDIHSDDMDDMDQQTQVQLHSQVKYQDEVSDAQPVVTNERQRRTRTPEPKQRRIQRAEAQRSPSTPGHLPDFDWEDFESRYMKAIAEADDKEKEILAEFERLVKYFNVWASAASSHDDERAVKRLQTRTRYVHLSEEKLNQKKQHLDQVVRAFQSALALLSAA